MLSILGIGAMVLLFVYGLVKGSPATRFELQRSREAVDPAGPC